MEYYFWLYKIKNNSNRVTLNNYKDKIKELIDQVKIYEIWKVNNENKS